MSAKHTVALDQDVRDILMRSTITRTSLTLPDERLDRPLYDRLNKVLVAAGGKWNRSAKAHIFPRDPRAALGLAMTTGGIVDTKRAMQQFFTPDTLAADLCRLRRGDVASEALMMPAARTTTTPITDAGIREAIRLKCSACFGALALCRGLASGGFEVEEWWLASTVTLKDLVDEATVRGLDVVGLINVDGDAVLTSMKFRHARGEVTDAELNYWWRGVKNGTIDTDGTVL